MCPNVIDNEELYTSIVYKGTSSPGQVTLTGHDRKINWDVKNGPSLDGATLQRLSQPPIEFTASFYLIKDVAQGIDDFAAWEPFQKLLESTLGKALPQAPPIYHPDLARNKITGAVVAEIGGMTYDGKGGGTVKVKFREYRAPRKRGGAPVVAPKVDPNADLKTQIDALTNHGTISPWNK